MKNILIVLILWTVFGCRHKKVQNGNAKTNENPEEANPVKERFAKMEAEALKEQYAGIFTKKDDSTELFQIRSTGVSTLPIQQAAEIFLKNLSASQIERTTFTIDDDEWRKWCNVDNGIYDRQGVSLKELTDDQKKMPLD